MERVAPVSKIVSSALARAAAISAASLGRGTPSSPSKSRPKWLRLSEGAVGPLCLLEHGRDARLLAARKTSGCECLLGAAFALFAAGVVHINDLLAQPLMHRDVVEVTEGVL